ncbi:hypothetical protein DFH28DRAFT_840133, partial [Melampsora americana]
MPRCRQVDAFKPSEKLIVKAVALLKRLKEKDLHLKDLLLTLFLGLDRDDELAISRRYLSTERGWPSTLNILMAFKMAVQKKEYGRLSGNYLTLKLITFETLQALKIVAKEGSRRRLAVLGEANHANEISHKFFDVTRTADRYAALKNATGFLWHLIRGSIARARGLAFENEASYLSDPDSAAVTDTESTEQIPNKQPLSARLENDSSGDSVPSDWSKSSSSGEEKEVEVLPAQTGFVSAGESEGSDWADEETGVVYVDVLDRRESWKNRVNTVSAQIPVEAKFFAPTDDDLIHWHTVTKCQLNQAYLDYILTDNHAQQPLHRPPQGLAKCIKLSRKPPAIDSITPTDPDIGSGTRIHVLAERYSVIINLLRYLIRNLRLRSGRVEMFRTKTDHINKHNLDKFLRWAKKNLTEGNKGAQPKEKKDLMQDGFLALQKVLLKEVTHTPKTRFRWGTPDVFAPDVEVSDHSSGDADA